MNGYGQFVWPAFIFSLTSCFYLYAKTKSELKKQEKIFSAVYKEVQTSKIKFIKRKKSIEEVLSVN